MLQEGRRLFGTDGIRGVANTELTPDFAMRLSRAAGEALSHGPVVIGRDTRRSGEMLSSALQAGFHSVGIDTVDVGVLPSGGVAHLTGATGAMMGAIVSASHNPASDNGIKLLGKTGAKLTDDEEDRVEARLRDDRPFNVAVGDAVGTRFPNGDASSTYLDFLIGLSEYSFRGLSIALDCANGAAFQTAPELFERLKAEVTVLAADPDGTNINDGVGATSPGFLVAEANGRLGLAFDGDADRLIAVDEDGRVCNGDVVMAILARHLRDRGELPGDAVVTTVMANLGFKLAMNGLGIEVTETPVGDRYVHEEMRRTGAGLGGEQSGHVLLQDRATGDGLLTGLRLLEVVASTGAPLKELRRVMIEFPQVLRNVQVRVKERLDDADAIWSAVDRMERRLGEEGRVLVRASGTEPLVRVMVEARESHEAAAVAEELVSVVRAELGSD